MSTHLHKTNPVHPLKVNFHHRAKGLTTKFWLFSDGYAYDTDGLKHFRWAQAHADFLRRNYGVAMTREELTTNDGAPLRLNLVRRGMIRINHKRRENSLTIEGCRQAFTQAALDSLRRMVVAHPGDIVHLTLNRFNRDATGYETFRLNLIGKQTPAEREAAWRAAIEPKTAPAPKPKKPAHTAPVILHTPPWLAEWFVDALSSDLGAVALNEPFSGTYVPARHYQRDPRVRSIMIEVNRGLYMNETLAQKTIRFNDTQAHLHRVLRKFAEFLNR